MVEFDATDDFVLYVLNTTVSVTFTAGVTIDRSWSLGVKTPARLPGPLGDGSEEATVELWVDGSIMELFVDGRVLTTRMYADNWNGEIAIQSANFAPAIFVARIDYEIGMQGQ